MPEKFDALIIGAGPSGATAALMLARAGWSVAVVEKSAFPRRKVCGEYVSATTLPLFRELGVEQQFSDLAGPPVREVGLFSGDSIMAAKMPEVPDAVSGWGRALGREHLDKILLDAAVRSGVTVWQPFSAVRLDQTSDGCLCKVMHKETRREVELAARVVIAAHGCWKTGGLPTQPRRMDVRPSDLFGFKAHFYRSELAPGLMPLLAFQGGYGGMVHTDAGRVSLSCCIRRDRLELCRQAMPGVQAVEAVLAYIQRSCRGVREALATAELDGAWLSVGPIRPGVHRWQQGRVYYVGNAAGEAHPVIAEGISMAAQSAWLLCRRLASAREKGLSIATLGAIGRDYAADWRCSFGPRLRAAAIIAHWAMSPAWTAVLLPVLRLFPSILATGARLAGKATVVTG